MDFGKLLTSKKLKFEDARLSDNLIIEQDCYEKCEITKAWSSFYESNNPAVNDLFIKNKAVIKRDDKYFLAEKAIFFIGHYNFWKKLLKRKSS